MAACRLDNDGDDAAAALQDITDNVNQFLRQQAKVRGRVRRFFRADAKRRGPAQRGDDEPSAKRSPGPRVPAESARAPRGRVFFRVRQTTRRGRDRTKSAPRASVAAAPRRRSRGRRGDFAVRVHGDWSAKRGPEPTASRRPPPARRKMMMPTTTTCPASRSCTTRRTE